MYRSLTAALTRCCVHGYPVSPHCTYTTTTLRYQQLQQQQPHDYNNNTAQASGRDTRVTAVPSDRRPAVTPRKITQSHPVSSLKPNTAVFRSTVDTYAKQMYNLVNIPLPSLNKMLMTYKSWYTADVALAAIRFQYSEQLTVVEYGLYIKVAFKHDLHATMMALFNESVDRQMSLWPSTYKYLARACGRTGDYVTATKVLKQMELHNIVPSVDVYNACMSSCVQRKAWSIMTAFLIRMTDAGIQPNTTTYNVMMRQSNATHQYQKTLRLLREVCVLSRQHARTSVDTLVEPIEPDVIDASPTDVYNATDNADEDMPLLQRTYQREIRQQSIVDIRPNKQSLQLGLRACVDMDDWLSAVDLVTEMATYGVRPDAGILHALITLCRKHNKMELAQRIIETHKDSASSSHSAEHAAVLQIKVCTTVAEVHNALNQCRAYNDEVPLPVYNAAISMFMRFNDVPSALDLWQHMQSEFVTYSSSTVTILMRGLTEARQWQAARKVYALAMTSETADVQPIQSITHSYVVATLNIAGDTVDAVEQSCLITDALGCFTQAYKQNAILSAALPRAIMRWFLDNPRATIQQAAADSLLACCHNASFVEVMRQRSTVDAVIDSLMQMTLQRKLFKLVDRTLVLRGCTDSEMTVQISMLLLYLRRYYRLVQRDVDAHLLQQATKSWPLLLLTKPIHVIVSKQTQGADRSGVVREHLLISGVEHASVEPYSRVNETNSDTAQSTELQEESQYFIPTQPIRRYLSKCGVINADVADRQCNLLPNVDGVSERTYLIPSVLATNELRLALMLQHHCDVQFQSAEVSHIDQLLAGARGVRVWNVRRLILRAADDDHLGILLKLTKLTKNQYDLQSAELNDNSHTFVDDKQHQRATGRAYATRILLTQLQRILIESNNQATPVDNGNTVSLAADT